MKKNILNMKRYSLNIKMLFNFIFLFIIIPNSEGQTILFFIDDTTSRISTMHINNDSLVYFHDERIYKYYDMDPEEQKKVLTPFIVNILTIDCEAKIEVPVGINYKKISHNNYNAYSIYFNILIGLNFYPLIKSSTEKNGDYRLIIKSIKMDKSNFPKLNITENEPVFLYFNDILKKINLVYNFNKSNAEYPIIASFYIQEKIKFKIKISDNKNKIIIEKIINYKENIEIKPETGKFYNIFITPEENIINTAVIVEIIHSNSKIFYLQKNQLNLGFLPIEIDYYYYYTEIFKGDEGEIMLFNKRQNGILISKIIKKYESNIEKIPKIEEFQYLNIKNMLSNNFLEFNIYNQN